jgi:hypothetical protein
MTKEQLKIVATDLLEGRIHSGLVITEYPTKDFVETAEVVAGLSSCRIVNSDRTIFVNGGQLMFGRIDNMQDCHLHAGRRFNAIYINSYRLGCDEFLYMSSRLRGGEGQRNYIELL